MENETQKTTEDKISIWENHAKGWLLSVLGYAILISDVLDYFGIITLPVYDGISKGWQTLISIVVAGIAFMAPRTFESSLEDTFKSLKDKFLK